MYSFSILDSSCFTRNNINIKYASLSINIDNFVYLISNSGKTHFKNS
jgi:hypothetical protein